MKQKGVKQMSRISLAAARVNAKLTQEEMANKLGITRQTYAAWESGKTDMRTAYFIAFCQITGFSTDDIFLPNESTESKQM
jgi:DNA-binding XRE family transcriptional regulator